MLGSHWRVNVGVFGENNGVVGVLVGRTDTSIHGIVNHGLLYLVISN